MKAMVLREAGLMDIREIPIPSIRSDQILVKNHFCAVCNATDLKMFGGQHAVVRYPCIIGHEGAGIVEQVGSDVKTVMPGDRVLGGSYPPSESLGTFWGQYAEYGVCNEKNIVRIPDNVTLEQATLAHMLGEALNAVYVSEVKAGDNIIILGCGAVGLSILSIVVHNFCNKIITIDLSRDKLAVAAKLGADYTIVPDRESVADIIKQVTDGEGARILFEAVGSRSTYDMAYELVNANGTIIPFGIVEGSLDLPFRKPYKKQLQMKWVSSTGVLGLSAKKIVLNMMSKGLIQTGSLITGTFELSQFEDAVESIKSGRQIRVLIRI